MNGKDFYKKYNNYTIIDDGAILSVDFKNFARDMKNALRFELTALGIKIVEFNVGHYYVSAFCERDGRYVYLSYSMPRYAPVSLDGIDPLNGFLYRQAKNEKDYTGGTNHFCNWKSLSTNIDSLIRGMA